MRDSVLPSKPGAWLQIQFASSRPPGDVRPVGRPFVASNSFQSRASFSRIHRAELDDQTGGQMLRETPRSVMVRVSVDRTRKRPPWLCVVWKAIRRPSGERRVKRGPEGSTNNVRQDVARRSERSHETMAPCSLLTKMNDRPSFAKVGNRSAGPSVSELVWMSPAG